MAEKLKIIPLGGLNEIGKNMTAYEYGGEIIVVDCGMAFPGDDMYGIDCVIPDVTYLIKNRSRLRGLFITAYFMIANRLGNIFFFVSHMRRYIKINHNFLSFRVN